MKLGHKLPQPLVISQPHNAARIMYISDHVLNTSLQRLAHLPEEEGGGGGPLMGGGGGPLMCGGGGGPLMCGGGPPRPKTQEPSASILSMSYQNVGKPISMNINNIYVYEYQQHYIYVSICVYVPAH